MNRPATVALCIPTYRRPQFLMRLLRSLRTLETDGLAVQIFVVDNDENASARAIVAQLADRLPGLVYAVEPKRGIAAARNRLVGLANDAGVDYIAFVDDDEWIEPGWLTELVATASEHEADAVAGPVLPDYDDAVPWWIAAGGFFDRPRFATGTRISIRSTNNLLLRRAFLEPVPGPFDRRFDLTGGSDTHLMERLRLLGARMVWCDEAVVHEQIPTSRTTTAWLLRRAYRSGLASSRTDDEFDSAPMNRVFRLLRTTASLGKGAIVLLPAIFLGRAATLRALRICTYHVGRVLGMVGVSYQEYRQVHGR